MTQPIPPGNITRVCVYCYGLGRQRRATVITNHRGIALCDEHSGHDHPKIMAALHKLKRR